MREKGWKVEKLDQSLNFDSGLKGIAGMSDMRELMDKKSEATAQLAIDMFVHRLQTAIGALAVSLGGVDVLSFTAGIGENSSEIRSRVCEKLGLFGLSIDEVKNRLCVPDAIITDPSSHVEVLVLHTEEEWMIARAALAASPL
jgi:acetate kinase